MYEVTSSEGSGIHDTLTAVELNATTFSDVTIPRMGTGQRERMCTYTHILHDLYVHISSTMCIDHNVQ